LIAGLEEPTFGEVQLLDRSTNRRIGFVFQGAGVFPWRTVQANLTYAAECNGATSRERSERAVDLCKLVGLDPSVFLAKYPRELSGGEERRVAIGMALSAGASLLLFDEATSQLDYVNKLRLQKMICSLWVDRRPTVVYVTHDIEEAILLGGRVVVMHKGCVVDAMDVPFAFPREDSVSTSSEFFELKQRVLRALVIYP
jgi:ABC-type nitrate/sulfonate/bicarbonate transport system ATPase subunit